MSDAREGSNQSLSQQHIFTDIDEKWMKLALSAASRAAVEGEVPVGAVIVKHNSLIAQASNSPIEFSDPTAHAEIIAIRKAAEKMKNYRLPETTLYVTLEPCVMCIGAIIHARIERLVFGANDPKTGAVCSLYTIGSDSRLNHTLNINGGLLAEQCAQLLKDFFKQKRMSKKIAKKEIM